MHQISNRKMQPSSKLYGVLAHTYFITLYLVSGHPQTYEYKLIERIMKNHSADVRPVTNIFHPIQVTFGMELIQLTKLDEIKQAISTKVWVRQYWHSDMMVWNPAEWGGILCVFSCRLS